MFTSVTNHLFIFTQLFLQAITLCNATYGDASVLSGGLHYNMGVLYHDRNDYNEAYDWFVKCVKIREKVSTIHLCHSVNIDEQMSKGPILNV